MDRMDSWSPLSVGTRKSLFLPSRERAMKIMPTSTVREAVCLGMDHENPFLLSTVFPLVHQKVQTSSVILMSLER